MIFHRFLPLLTPLLVLAFQELFFFRPKQIYLASAMVILIIFFTVWQFSRASEIDKHWWNFLILPAVMSAAVMLYSVFLGNKLIIQSLFILNTVFLYLFLRYTYYYLLNPLSYDVFSIENISSYLNWLSFFLLASALYGLQSYLSISILWLALIITVAGGLLVYQMIWVNKITGSTGLLYVLVSCLILIELFWSISFLPFNFNISGLLLAICYYIIIGLEKNFLLQKLDARKVKQYLLVGAISLFLVLLTAKWA